MLSVRSLAKIAARKKEGADGAANGVTMQIKGKSLLSAAGALLSPKALPTASGYGRRSKTVRIVEVGRRLSKDGLELAHPNAAANIGIFGTPEPPRQERQCPTLPELYNRTSEIWADVKRQGGIEFAVAVVTLITVVETLHGMMVMLTSVFNLETPSVSKGAEAILRFSEQEPILFLLYNFSFGIGVGATYFFNATLAAHCKALSYTAATWSARTFGRGYAELEDAEGSAVEGDIEEANRVDGTDPERGLHSASEADGAPVESDLEQRRAELRRTCDLIEELEIKFRVHHRKSAASVAAKELSEQLQDLRAQRDHLMAKAKLHSSAAQQKGEGPTADHDAPQQTAVQRLMGGAVMQLVIRSANGICTRVAHAHFLLATALLPCPRPCPAVSQCQPTQLRGVV
jgi:hypothetical protein